MHALEADMTVTTYHLECPYMLHPNGRENTSGLAICAEINAAAMSQGESQNRSFFERALAPLADDADLYGITIEEAVYKGDADE